MTAVFMPLFLIVVALQSSWASDWEDTRINNLLGINWRHYDYLGHASFRAGLVNYFENEENRQTWRIGAGHYFDIGLESGVGFFLEGYEDTRDHTWQPRASLQVDFPHDYSFYFSHDDFRSEQTFALRGALLGVRFDASYATGNDRLSLGGHYRINNSVSLYGRGSRYMSSSGIGRYDLQSGLNFNFTTGKARSRAVRVREQKGILWQNESKDLIPSPKKIEPVPVEIELESIEETAVPQEKLFLIQFAALTKKEMAEQMAKKRGGFVQKFKRFWRVRAYVTENELKNLSRTMDIWKINE